MEKFHPLVCIAKREKTQARPKKDCESLSRASRGPRSMSTSTVRARAKS